jgi:DNA topoisomerase IA
VLRGPYNVSQQRQLLRQWLQAKIIHTRAVHACRVYKAKAKNSQEAHEAIRPTDPLAQPSSLTGAGLDADQVRGPRGARVGGVGAPPLGCEPGGRP